MRYCLDACSIITPMTFWYKPERLPSLWAEIDKHLKSGAIFSIKEVFEELRSDTAKNWAKDRREYFLDLDGTVIANLPQIMSDFPSIIQPTQNDQADPYLVAYALTHKDTCIVTEEKIENKKKRVSIPHVCNEYKIRHIKFYELIDELQITI